MWESRVVCEISKALWRPFCGFHSAGISIAAFPWGTLITGDRVARDRVGSPRSDDRILGRVWLPLGHER